MVLQTLIPYKSGQLNWPDYGMALRMKIFSVLLFFLFSISTAFAQNRIKVKDPDLTFSYILPEGWSKMDEELYHNIISPDKSAIIKITYFEGKCPDLNDCYLGEVEAIKAGETTNFKFLANGTEMIEGNLAYWFRYSGTNPLNHSFQSYMYVFIWNDQYFQIQAFIHESTVSTWNDDILSTVRSLKVSKK